MKRRVLLVALVSGAVALIWMLVRSLPPVPLTAQCVGRTNYPSGWLGCLIAVTNVTTNELVVLVPMDLNAHRRTRVASVPTNLFFCPVKLSGHHGKVVSFLQTGQQPREVVIHFGTRREFHGFGYRLRRWLRLPRGQPRDFLSNPQTVVVEVPP